MFGSLTLTLDKSVLLAIVAVAVAVCACTILKTSLERLINGNIGPKLDPHARKKGAFLAIISIVLIAASIVAILESEDLTAFLSQQIKVYKKLIIPSE